MTGGAPGEVKLSVRIDSVELTPNISFTVARMAAAEAPGSAEGTEGAAPGAAEPTEGAEATLAPARAVEGAAPGHEAGAGAGGTEEERSEVP